MNLNTYFIYEILSKLITQGKISAQFYLLVHSYGLWIQPPIYILNSISFNFVRFEYTKQWLILYFMAPKKLLKFFVIRKSHSTLYIKYKYIFFCLPSTIVKDAHNLIREKPTALYKSVDCFFFIQQLLFIGFEPISGLIYYYIIEKREQKYKKKKNLLCKMMLAIPNMDASFNFAIQLDF